MKNKFRQLPLTCLIVSIFRLITGKLKISAQFLGQMVKADNNSNYQIFRHIKSTKERSELKSVVFIVSFKFSHLSHRANKLASIIPMLLISGFPGFQTKMYAVNKENGYWQGMYQWKTQKHLEEYLKSFVYKMMNKRAIPESIKSFQIENESLDAYIIGSGRK